LSDKQPRGNDSRRKTTSPQPTRSNLPATKADTDSHVDPEIVEAVEVATKRAAVTATRIAMQYSGPLPPPNMLAQYEKILPGMAERMMLQVEGQTAHRHRIEGKLLDKDYGLKTRGQFLAILALFMLLTIIGMMVWFGHPTQAAWLGAATLVGVVSVFVLGNQPDPITPIDEKQLNDLEQLESPGSDSQ
jgi:uncharacterized membrane protein